jgi:type I restriction enzyme, S subunit
VNQLLPEEWLITTINEVTINTAQRQPQQDKSFIYIDIGSIDRENKCISTPERMLGQDAPSRARKVVQTGDVLVSTTRPNLNAVAMVPDKFNDQIASTGFDVLRAPNIDPRWLFYIVRTTDFVQSMSELVQGALYPAIRSKDIRSFEIPLAPLNEQKRIADKLDRLLEKVDACRERCDRIPLILKRFRQSVLTAATSGELTEDWRISSKYDEYQWQTVSSDEICLSITDGDHQAPPIAQNGIPFITISAINTGKLQINKATRFVPASYFEGLKHIRKPIIGDVLFSVTGSIAIPALVDSHDKFTFQRHIAILKPDQSKILSRWVKLNIKWIELKPLR